LGFRDIELLANHGSYRPWHVLYIIYITISSSRAGSESSWAAVGSLRKSSVDVNKFTIICVIVNCKHVFGELQRETVTCSNPLTGLARITQA
jgi:hypothetical protein